MHLNCRLLVVVNMDRYIRVKINKFILFSLVTYLIVVPFQSLTYVGV